MPPAPSKLTVNSIIQPVKEKWMFLAESNPKELVKRKPYTSVLQKVQTFYPVNMKEFGNPTSFVERSDVKEALLKYGIIKVVPPSDWDPTDHEAATRMGSLNVLLQKFEKQSTKGAYLFSRGDVGGLEFGVPAFFQRSENAREDIEDCWKTFREFYRFARNGKIDRDELIHQKYWRCRDGQRAYYASDISGTLMRPDLECWHFPSRDDRFPCLTNKQEEDIDGVSIPYLYFALPGATFGWHTEDADFLSVNYLHDEEQEYDGGAPKIWYAVPPGEASKLEKVAAKLYPGIFKSCGNPMRHKAFVIDPLLLVDEGITVYTATQNRGEIIITAPLAYHSGFNVGVNVAEARNLATKDWIPYGLSSKRCTCPAKDRMDPVPVSYVEEICRKENETLFKEYQDKKSAGSLKRPLQLDSDDFEFPGRKQRKLAP